MRRTSGSIVAVAAVLGSGCVPDRPTQPSFVARSGVLAHVDASAPGIDGTIISMGIGGAYTVEPRGGRDPFTWFPQETANLLIWPIRPPQPSGLYFPAGWPVRVIATGIASAAPTADFLEFCASSPTMFVCTRPRPLRFYPWGFEDTRAGPMQVQWGPNRFPQIRGEPADSTITAWTGPVDADTGVLELHVGRVGTCCYGLAYFPANPFNTIDVTPFQTASGDWVVTLQPEDGSAPETFANPVVWMEGPATHTVPNGEVEMRVRATPGATIGNVEWIYAPDVANRWDGTPITAVAALRASSEEAGLPSLVSKPGVWVPGPDGELEWAGEVPAKIGRRPTSTRAARPVQRQVRSASGAMATIVNEPSLPSALALCANSPTCRFAPEQPESFVAKVTLGDGRVLTASNARNTDVPPTITIEVTMLGGDSIVPSGTRFSGTRPVTRAVDINVRTADGTPVVGRVVTLRVVADSLQAGGHSHGEQPVLLHQRPAGQFVVGVDTVPTATVTTGVDGRVRVTYVASTVGGTEVIRTTSAGIDSVSQRVILAVPGIVAVSDTTANYFMRPTRNHSPTHNYARRGVIEAVDSLLGLYRSRHRADSVGKFPFTGENGGRFRIDAVGLPRGGLYDVNGRWNTLDGHNWHREGLEVDVNDQTTGSGAESRRGREALYDLCINGLLPVRPRTCLYHLGHFHITYGTSGGAFP